MCRALCNGLSHDIPPPTETNADQVVSGRMLDNSRVTDVVLESAFKIPMSKILSKAMFLGCTRTGSCDGSKIWVVAQQAGQPDVRLRNRSITRTCRRRC